MQNKKILKKSVSFIILNLTANFVNYFSNIIISWKLIWDEYWKIMAIFSLIVLYAIPTQIIQIHISNKTALNESYELKDDIIFYNQFWIVYTLFLLPLFYLIKWTLEISFSGYLLILIHTFLVFNLTLLRWFMQWKKEFHKLWISYFTEVISKFAIMVFLLFYLSKWINWILFSIIISLIISIILANNWCNKSLSLKNIFSLWNWNEWNLIKTRLNEIRNFLGLFIWISWVILFMNMDMLLVKHFIPKSASIYAIYSKLWQIIYMWWNILIQISIPTILTIYSQKKSTRNNFLTWFWLILISWLGLIFIFNLFWKEIILKLFKNNIKDTYFLVILSLWYLSLILWNYCTNYLLALKKYYTNYAIIFSIMIYILSINIISWWIEKYVFWFFIGSNWYLILSLTFLLYFKKTQKKLTI